MFEVSRCPIMSALGPNDFVEISYKLPGRGERSFACPKGELEWAKARMSNYMRESLAEHRALEIIRRGMVHDMGTYI